MANPVIPPPAGFELVAAPAPLADIPPPPPGFEVERRKQPRIASGVWEAAQAGYQGSLPGLMDRKQLPDIVVDRKHNKWYEEVVASAAQMIHEMPESIVGAMAGAPVGGLAGSVLGPVGAVVGGLAGAGAGGMALPTALREAYIQSLEKGEVTSSTDFLERTKIVAKKTGIDAAIGAAMGPLGMAGGRGVGRMIAPQIGETISVPAATKMITAGNIGAEVVGIGAIAPLMHGQLPEWQDFLNGAVMVGGMRAATSASSKANSAIKATYDAALGKAPEAGRRMGALFAKAGVRPEEVVDAARKDPQIADDLWTVPKTTPQITKWALDAGKELPLEGVTNSAELSARITETMGEGHFAAVLLDKLGERFKGYKVEVLSEQEWALRGYSAQRAAQANPKDMALQFKKNATNESALHEITHEATQLELQVNPSFKSDIRSIMDHTNAEVAAGRVADVSAAQLRRLKAALTSEAEFVAYGLTNPEVIDVLRGIKGQTPSAPTLFTRFVEAVAKAFGFGEKDYTALHDLIRAVERGVDTTRPYEGGSAKDFLRGSKAENAAADQAKVDAATAEKQAKEAAREQRAQEKATAAAAAKAAHEAEKLAAKEARDAERAQAKAKADAEKAAEKAKAAEEKAAAKAKAAEEKAVEKAKADEVKAAEKAKKEVERAAAREAKAKAAAEEKAKKAEARAKEAEEKAKRKDIEPVVKSKVVALAKAAAAEAKTAAAEAKAALEELKKAKEALTDAEAKALPIVEAEASAKAEAAAAKAEAAAAKAEVAAAETAVKSADENVVKTQAAEKETAAQTPKAVEAFVAASEKALAEQAARDPLSEFGPEVPRAYKKQVIDQIVDDAFPGDKAERVLDHPYADIPEAQVPFQMNLKSVEGPESLRALIAKMNEVYLSEQKTQSHAETEAKAEAIFADMMGPEGQKILKGRERGTAASAVEMKVRGDLLMQAASEAAVLIEAYNKAKAENKATGEMKIDALDAINKLKMLQEDFAGGLTEAARAVEYAKRFKQVRQDASRMSELVEMYGKDPDVLLEIAGLVQTPQQIAKIAATKFKHDWFDMHIEVLKSIVLGPISQVTNFVGSAVNAAYAIPKDFVAAVGGQVHPAEGVARSIGYMIGTRNAFELALTYAGEKASAPGTFGGKLMDSLRALDVGDNKSESMRAIPGDIGVLVRSINFTPMRLVDVLWQNIISQGELYTLAVRQASNEGRSLGTKEFNQRVAELVRDPSPEWQKQMEFVAKKETFQLDLGKFGKSITRALSLNNLPDTPLQMWGVQLPGVRTMAGPLRSFMAMELPYVRTPALIFKSMFEKTLAAPFVDTWRAEFEAGGARRHKAIADVVIGTSLSATVMGLVATGSEWITGGLDPDPAKRNVIRSDKQPYSVKVNGTWYSYQWLQPFGTLMGAAVDTVQAWNLMDKGEQARAAHAVALGFTNAITNQSMLQGAGNILKLFGADSDRYVEKIVQGMAAMHVPAWIAQSAALNDPYIREVQSVLDAVQNRTWLRQKLEVSYDPFGQPVPNPDRFGMVSPIKMREESENKVIQEAVRLGVGVDRTPKAVQLPVPTPLRSGELGKVQLTPEQRTIFAEASGQFIMDTMTKFVDSPKWDRTPEGQQKMIFADVIKSGRELGNYRALPPEQRKEEMNKVITVLRKKLENQPGPAVE